MESGHVLAMAKRIILVLGLLSNGIFCQGKCHKSAVRGAPWEVQNFYVGGVLVYGCKNAWTGMEFVTCLSHFSISITMCGVPKKVRVCGTTLGFLIFKLQFHSLVLFVEEEHHNLYGLPSR